MHPAYRPEIDGLRAVAVLPVIGFHAGFTGFSGGFVGVDVFFVISGYLITQILANDLRTGNWSIGRFYERRARRLLPALFVVLAASTVAAHLLLLPPAFKDYAASVFAVALFLSNMLFISEVDYFAPAAEETPLLHTWSLAVEEQFYILFPLILWMLWRLGRERGLFWGAAILTLASLAFSEWAWRNYPSESFYFLPSRAWELGAGALCALIPRPRAARLGDGLALAGLLAILGSVVLLDRSYPFPSFWAAIPVAGSVALILFARPENLAGRLLSIRAVVAVGLISYSAYLWHNPVFVFARVYLGGEPGTAAMLVLSLLSLGLAALSWRLVEQPFRQGPGRSALLPARGQVFAASGAGIVACIAFGLWGWFTEGRAALWLATASPDQQRSFALIEAATVPLRNLDTGPCQFNTRRIEPGTEARLLACRETHGPGLAIIGDSHAINLADALILGDVAPFVFGMTEGGCRPDASGPDCGLGDFAELAARQPDLFARVVIEIAGQHLVEGPGRRQAEELFAFYGPHAAIGPEIRLLEDRIAATLAYAEALAAHVPVVWLTPRIEPHIGPGRIIQHGCSHPFELRPGQAELFQRIGTEIARQAQAGGQIAVLDQSALLNFTMPQDFMTCEALHWRDADHLSPSGLNWLAQRLAPHLVP